MRFFRYLVFLPFLNFLACGSPIETAPDFELPTLLYSSKPVKLFEEIKEHPVLLVFWASWCPTCVSEIPALNKLQQKALENNLRIYAINIEESREEVEKFVMDRGIKYPVLLDEDGKVSEAYKVHALPTMILLAKGGKILYYGFRLPENYLERLDQL